MKGNVSIKLWEACFDKPLFRNILEEIVSNTSSRYLLEVMEYCHERYSDIHPDVLSDVFSNLRKNINNELPVQANSDKPLGLLG